ncbi:MAG: PTS transporter subunit EIIC [Oscillospiraceae bacterium]|nr:PTS transporter subunit EIIC [Oscillospiraceae bacterium]
MEKKKESFFDSKFMQGLQRFGERISMNKGFSAIQQAMMGIMAIILVGSIFQIICSVGTLLKLFTADSAIYSILYMPYNLTGGIMSVYVVFLIAYSYGKSLGLKPLQTGIVALACFLITCAPAKAYTLADGSALTAMDTSYLGGTGLFVAILIGILSVRIMNFCIRKKIYIRMPDVVPPFLADSFAALVPMLVNMIIWYGLSALLSAATAGALNLPLLITYLLSIPIAALNSVPGMVVVFLIATLLWCFGIHGTMVVYIGLMAILMQVVTANAAAVAAGGQAQFYPVLLMGALATAGGTGNTFGCVLLGLRSKSKQISAVSKAALVPGLFGINEPVTFGYPIMYNPILCIPYILTPIITMLLVWVGYAIGFFKPAYVLMMSLMPMGVSEFLGSLAWQNLFIPVIGIVVGLIVFAPFLKAYEKILVEKEAKAEAAETEAQA